eukprot:352980-Chlamydomonas_euryale.AAC.5
MCSAAAHTTHRHSGGAWNVRSRLRYVKCGVARQHTFGDCGSVRACCACALSPRLRRDPLAGVALEEGVGAAMVDSGHA